MAAHREWVACEGPGAVWVVAGRPTSTNELVVGALHERGVRAAVVPGPGLAMRARVGDIVLGRLDVRPSLDGVEPGLWELRRAERSGVRLLNRASSLVACHDKLQTARALGRSGVRQPVTTHLRRNAALPELVFPVVVKPRFGSWGREVAVCASPRELARHLDQLSTQEWFRRQGVLVQEFVPPLGFDLRIVVAGGRVIGAIRRVTAAGEWRTNVALGGRREAADPSPDACALATAAAAAVGADLAGVDLLPLPHGGYVVLEVNGAVDFTHEYALAEADPFEAVADMIQAAAAQTGLDVVGLAD
jgi:[lysine-biosynthesis-protein LysW]---L-2-aminoadipate ligase